LQFRVPFESINIITITTIMIITIEGESILTITRHDLNAQHNTQTRTNFDYFYLFQDLLKVVVAQQRKNKKQKQIQRW
jgi:hypothetical protein